VKRAVSIRQANDVFEAVKQAGLDPDGFRWSHGKSPTKDYRSRLEHAATGYYYFQVDFEPDPDIGDEAYSVEIAPARMT